jgi:hypothetical protein
MTMPPKKSSQPEIIRDSEKLLSAVASNPTLLPDLSDLTGPLEQTIAEIKVLSGRQETLKADKQKATQDLRAAFDRARDQAIQIRAAVKSRLGPRTEKLVEFQVAPLRPRSRSTKKKPAVPAIPTRPPALAGDPSTETA